MLSSSLSRSSFDVDVNEVLESKYSRIYFVVLLKNWGWCLRMWYLMFFLVVRILHPSMIHSKFFFGLGRFWVCWSFVCLEMLLRLIGFAHTEQTIYGSFLAMLKKDEIGNFYKDEILKNKIDSINIKGIIQKLRPKINSRSSMSRSNFS